MTGHCIRQKKNLVENSEFLFFAISSLLEDKKIGMWWLARGFQVSLYEDLSMFNETTENYLFCDKHFCVATYIQPTFLL